MWNIKRDGVEEAVRRRAQDGIISALERSQAIIEFDPTGRILHANRNFLDAMGYGLDEVHGQHHSVFVGPDRRFHNIGPPGGVPRRTGDLSIEVGAASGPNMSQDEIDSLMRPMKIMAE